MDEIRAAYEDKKLQENCRQFEALLLNSMLKAMRKTIEKTGLFYGGRAEEIYTSMLDQEYSNIISRRSEKGIAEALYKQLKRKEAPQGVQSHLKIEGLY